MNNKKPISYKYSAIVMITFSLVALFLGSNAQTTYKVVCDKTDNTVKVIESDNRSTNYVPIKGGFPFRQIAQKWIDENYNTTVCNPVEIIKQIQNEDNNTQQAPKSNSANQPSPQSPTPAPVHTKSVASRQYYNSSFIANAKFSNLGKAFSSDKNITPGLNVGFEQLFGKKNYFGIGASLDIYFAEFPTTYNFDKMTFFFGKFPLFFGQRIDKKNFLLSYEAGVEFNTKIVADDEDFEIPGQDFRSYSFDLMARFKGGIGKAQLTLGAELWISQIFEEHDFNMSAFYVGLNFAF